MVTYDSDTASTNPLESEQTSPTASTPTRRTDRWSRRPIPGGRLHRTRRAVLLIRLLLGGVALVCGFVANATGDRDVGISNLWTAGMAVAICLLLAGGLCWWVEPGLPHRVRRKQRRRTVGRLIRGGMATGCGIAFFLSIFAGHENISVTVLLLSPFSLLAYPLAMLGTPSDAELSAADATNAIGDTDSADPDVRRRAQAHAIVARHSTVFVDGEPDVRSVSRSVTVRPRQPVGDEPPTYLRSWLANGALSTDGRTVSVTDGNGTLHTRGLASGPAGADPNGVATIVVRREVVRIVTGRGSSLPDYRHALSLLDPAGRRLLDLELFGWTRSDLVEFARTGGLGLWMYQPDEVGIAGSTWGGRSMSAFDLAHPPAPEYVKVPGASRRGAILLTLGAVVGMLAVIALGFGTAVWTALLVPSGWSGITSTVAAMVVLFSGSLAVITMYNRANRNRQRPTEPPDAIGADR